MRKYVNISTKLITIKGVHIQRDGSTWSLVVYMQYALLSNVCAYA